MHILKLIEIEPIYRSPICSNFFTNEKLKKFLEDCYYMIFENLL